MMDFSAAQWRKSTRSSSEENSDCVELADLGVSVGIRDSKNPQGPKLAVSPTHWRTLTREIRTGRHDLP